MKILKIKVSNFRGLKNGFEIDFIPKSKRTQEDKEFELLEIDTDLFVYSTLAFIGTTSSGKSTVIELLSMVNSLLSTFRVSGSHNQYNNIDLDIYFYESGVVYRYTTTLTNHESFVNVALFTNEHIYKRKYRKSNLKEIYDDDFYDEIKIERNLPADTSILYYALKNQSLNALCFDKLSINENPYRILFKMVTTFGLDYKILSKVMHIFDKSVISIRPLKKGNFELVTIDCTSILSCIDLTNRISSSTTRGVLVFIFSIICTSLGKDLIIDNIEYKLEQTFIKHILLLFKDQSINKKQARLIFTTAQPDVLDLFTRQDNINIIKKEGYINAYNMYSDFSFRNDLLKSKQYTNYIFSRDAEDGCIELESILKEQN